MPTIMKNNRKIDRRKLSHDTRIAERFERRCQIYDRRKRQRSADSLITRFGFHFSIVGVILSAVFLLSEVTK